jgi:hypothetical protein
VFISHQRATMLFGFLPHHYDEALLSKRFGAALGKHEEFFSISSGFFAEKKLIKMIEKKLSN